MALAVTISSVTKSSFKASVKTTGAVKMNHKWFLNNVLYKEIITEKGITSSSYSFTNLKSGTTYTAMVVVCRNDTGKELDRGSASATTIKDAASKPVRPKNWNWQNAITTGAAIKITAKEWNDFIKRIEEFAVYKGVSLSSSTKSTATAAKGARMMASQANAVRSLISSLRPSKNLPGFVNPGDTITATFVNGLKDSLNSIS